VALPLEGFRVLDLSRALAGPHCAQLLGDLGAEVIKVEDPNRPDEIRGWPPFAECGVSTYFLTANRNKHAITLDLATEHGLAALHELIDTADVLVENFRPDVSARFGLDPATLRTRHPRAVLATVQGFAEGELVGTPAYDMSIQARSGIMGLTGEAGGPPSRVGVAVVDQSSALYAAVAVLGALVGRRDSGEGAHVSVALFDAAVSSAAFPLLSWMAAGVEFTRTGTAHPAMTPNKVMPTANGNLLIMAGKEGQWVDLCRVLGVPELIEDPRFRTNADRVAAAGELYPLLEEVLRTRTSEEWQQLLAAVRVPAAPVSTMPQVASYLAANSTLPTRFSPPDSDTDVPLLASPIRLNGERLPVRTLPLAAGQDNAAYGVVAPDGAVEGTQSA